MAYRLAESVNILQGLTTRTKACAMLKVTRLVLTALLLCNISLADAALLDWDLIGITFNDGATASGSFTFDTDLNVVTEFDITTTAGTLITSAFNYTVATAHISLQANEAVEKCVSEPAY